MILRLLHLSFSSSFTHTVQIFITHAGKLSKRQEKEILTRTEETKASNTNTTWLGETKCTPIPKIMTLGVCLGNSEPFKNKKILTVLTMKAITHVFMRYVGKCTTAQKLRNI